MTDAGATPLSDDATTAIVGLLDRERLLTIACVRPDGWPQATTAGYLNDGLNLYLVVARASQKLANLQADPRASVAIRAGGPGRAGDTVGLSMAGRVAEVMDPAVVDQLNRLVRERYPEVAVYCPSGDAVAILHFKPSIISTIRVAHGRSDTETFSVVDTATARPLRLS